ncbi:MAG: DUF1566 domain-containing protein [Methylococcales bacterium]
MSRLNTSISQALFLFVLFVNNQLAQAHNNQWPPAQKCESSIPATTPTSRFIIHSNSTVTDTNTGLMWKRCVEGKSGDHCLEGEPLPVRWKDSFQQAASSDFAGYTDWRVPNIKELRSIVEHQCYDPAINLTVFPGDTGEDMWSSSPFADGPASAWIIYFYDGYAYSYYLRDEIGWLRMVRGGQ